MYFQECEHLAKEYPELREIIGRINDIFHETGPSGVFRPEDIASQLHAKLSQITGIFEMLAKNGLLREEENIECPKCYNLLDVRDYKKAVDDQDSFECSQCQSDLTKQFPNRVKVYRLNPSKIPVSKPEKEIKKEVTLVPEGFYQKLPMAILKDPFKNAHLLHYYCSEPEFKKKRPFENKRVFFLLHFLRDLIPFVEATVKLGLDLKNAYFFYKDYPYPQIEAVRQWLKDKGAIVEPRANITHYLKQLDESPPKRIGKILIIEDGGFIVPAIHQQFPNLIQYVVGAVEQTTRGIRNAEQLKELKFPLISVATSKLKSEFEPPYIAKAVINNIQRMLPNLALNGKSIGLFGCGIIGKEISNWLRENGANITIFDLSPDNLLWAQQKGFTIADSPAQTVQNKNIIIGASGNTSINSDVIANLPHGSYLVSASSELYEIDSEELLRQQVGVLELKNDSGDVIGIDFKLPPNDRVVHVLANGYPINFWKFESMPEEASDLILSLILLCAAEVASGNYGEPKINSEAVNELAEKYGVAKKFREFHK